MKNESLLLENFVNSQIKEIQHLKGGWVWGTVVGSRISASGTYLDISWADNPNNPECNVHMGTSDGSDEGFWMLQGYEKP